MHGGLGKHACKGHACMTGVCMFGGMHVWQGHVCMVGRCMCGRGMHGRQGMGVWHGACVHGRGHVCGVGACMCDRECVFGGGVYGPGDVHAREMHEERKQAVHILLKCFLICFLIRLLIKKVCSRP